MSDAKKEVGNRLREFAERFGGPSGLARQLGIGRQQLNDYLSGRFQPGNKMQERLRELGCDTIQLITGRTIEEINRRHEKNSERMFETEHPTRYAGLRRFEEIFGPMSIQMVNEIYHYWSLGKEMAKKVAEAPAKYREKRRRPR